MHIGFPANVNPWLTFSVQTITGATTAMVAWFVARISKRNSEIARQKLRLDLYERRYTIAERQHMSRRRGQQVRPRHLTLRQSGTRHARAETTRTRERRTRRRRIARGGQHRRSDRQC